jgi:hypothetical protein
MLPGAGQAPCAPRSSLLGVIPCAPSWSSAHPRDSPCPSVGRPSPWSFCARRAPLLSSPSQRAVPSPAPRHSRAQFPAVLDRAWPVLPQRVPAELAGVLCFSRLPRPLTAVVLLSHGKPATSLFVSFSGACLSALVKSRVAPI